jgi:hypothetical protein
MKTTLLSVATLLSLIALLHSEPSAPPSLSLPKAAAIAQTTLDGLKLPPEYFLKSISYQPASDKEPTAFYLASFEPTKITRVKVGSTPEPVKIKYIKVLLDGTSSVIEKELPSSRRIIKPEKK